MKIIQVQTIAGVGQIKVLCQTTTTMTMDSGQWPQVVEADLKVGNWFTCAGSPERKCVCVCVARDSSMLMVLVALQVDIL